MLGWFATGSLFLLFGECFLWFLWFVVGCVYVFLVFLVLLWVYGGWFCVSSLLGCLDFMFGCYVGFAWFCFAGVFVLCMLRSVGFIVALLSFGLRVALL